MPLFFDSAWFDAKLAENGLDREILAAAAGLSPADLALVWKDQRELSRPQVTAFAALLGVTPSQIADHAGLGTPQPWPESRSKLDLRVESSVLSERLDQIEQRLLRIERVLGSER
jgi:hypothetical protein